MVEIIEAASYDTAIGLTGNGRFHYELFAVCSLCFLASGFENGISAYFVPAARCELRLTSDQVGFVIASFLVGGTLSAILWGVIADLAGRRVVILSTLLAAATVSTLSSFSPNFATLLAARFANGFLMGAPGSITYSYLAEFYPPAERSRVICYSGIFYTLSWLILPVVAWAVHPLAADTLKYNLNFDTWRVLLLVMAIPEIAAGVWLLRLPESPKYLLVQGNARMAHQVLRDIYAKNTGKRIEEFPVRALAHESVPICCVPLEVMCRGRSARLLHEIGRQLKCLFHAPNLLFITLANVMFFANVFGYYGLGLWMPQLFSRFLHQQDTNTTTTVCELYTTLPSPQHETTSCTQPPFDDKVFSDTLIVGFFAILSNITSGCLAGRFHPKVLPVSAMLLGGLASGALYWARSRAQTLLIACVFQSAMATANVALNSVCVNMFPTAISGLAVAMATMFGRIGAIISNVVFGSLIDDFCTVPILLVAGILVIGGLFGLYIPDREKNGNGDGDGTADGRGSKKISHVQDLMQQEYIA